MNTFQESVEFDALYDSMWKCRCGKMWKASVARYVLHGIDETLKLEEEIASGAYKPPETSHFHIDLSEGASLFLDPHPRSDSATEPQ